MPIIPRIDEAQVISSGSPVAIAGTGDARLMSGATDQLGSAILKMGQQLSSIENEASKEKNKYDTSIRTSQFAAEMATLNEELRNSESYAQGSNYNELNQVDGPDTPKKYMELSLIHI
jgi:hypothetical protein